jgi:class 3 adenylate cyclase
MAIFERERQFEFAADAESIWPAIANTNLVSEIIGAGRYQAKDELQADGSVLRHAHGDKLGPIAKQWTEDLGEWVYARFCKQRRWFVPDGSEYLEYVATIEPENEITKVKLRVEINGAKPIVWLGIRLGMVSRQIDKLFAAQCALIEAEITRSGDDVDARRDPIFHLPYSPPELAERASRRLPEVRRNLARLTGDDELSECLVDFLIRALEDFLSRIRPLELARKWRAEPDHVVDLFLAAHNVGLVSLRWEILCPRCRNSSTPSATLDDLPRELHCTTCNVDYERDFSHNVELLFSPEPWLRPMPDGVACMLGASSTPHIVVQRHVEAGSQLAIDPPIGAGSYRIRTPQSEGQHEIQWDGQSAFPEFAVADSRLSINADSPPGQIKFVNNDARRVTFVVEELAWRSDALTGDQAIARAAFRRYCPGQLLRAGDEVRISNVALMFTDLKGSTSLYEAIGDAAAYKLVRDHFTYLTDVVEAHRGILVKTMGDAIMAAFSDGADAVMAGIRLQAGVADFNQGRDDGGVVLKIGLHHGSCIAVTADGRLDYFGSMVNLAARLQGESLGGDIVLSTDLVDVVSPDVLSQNPANFEMSRDTATLRGFQEPISFWRMKNGTDIS